MSYGDGWLYELEEDTVTPGEYRREAVHQLGAVRHVPLVDVFDVDDPDGWRDDAACRRMDNSWWFPSPGRGGEMTYLGAKVCAGCPVRVSCLDFALDSGQEHGMWGGHTPDELRRIRRKRRS